MDDSSTLATSDTLLPRLDVVGAGASFLCAVHCAAMPILLATVPLAGIEALASHGAEQVFVVLAAVFGFVVIGSGYCRHRLAWVAIAFLAGVAALVAGAFFVNEPATHALLLASGGILLGTAHATNRRGVQRHACARSAFQPA